MNAVAADVPVMIHAMNRARQEAFDAMRRLNAPYSVTPKGGFRTYWLDSVMGSSMADALDDLGWLTVSPSRKGRPSQIHLTDIGVWILGGAS